MRPLPAATLFRAYDVRGIAGQDLTPAAAEAIGHALGSDIAARGLGRCALGRDGRLSSPELHAAAARGLSAAGIYVLDVGLVATPVLYFAAHEHADGCGIMVTGSHNPPEHNGLKMLVAGEALADERIGALRERIVGGELRHGTGSVSPLRVHEPYAARLLGTVRLKAPRRLVIDGANGPAGELAAEVLEALGCEVHRLHCRIDGSFPGHAPDPCVPANLADLRAAVVAQGADLGFAFDGDGDRLVVIGPGGEILWPDRILNLFARDILARRPGAEVVFDVKCGAGLARTVAEAGGRPVLWRSGHSPIKARMRAGAAPLGGEMTGHYFFADEWYGFDDGIYAALRLLSLIDGREPADVFASLPVTAVTPELRVSLPRARAESLVADALARVSELGGRVVTIDGVRIDYDDGFGLIRVSNTAAELVLRFEGSDAAALERIQSVFRSLLLDLEPRLAIPF